MKQHSKLVKLPIKLRFDDGIHYNCNKYYSYDVFFGCIDGGRGIGKTTTFLIKGLMECNKGHEFIYMRRYKPEIKKFVTKDSMSPIIDNVLYKGDGAGGYTAMFDGRILGYMLPLVTYRSYKSVDFSKVTLIIFDEAFVRANNSYRYLVDEVTQFLEFISTVIRTRKNVKVVLLGNNEDMFSPYHTFFKIPMFERYYINAERGIFCEHAKNSEALLEEEKQTGLFKLIQGTSYGDYHYDNKLLQSSNIVIEQKPPNASLMFRIVVEGQTLNMYTYMDNKKDMRMYCEHRDKVIKDNISYSIMEEGKINYLDADMFKKRLKKYVSRFYFNEKITYSNEKGGAIIGWIIENL